MAKLQGIPSTYPFLEVKNFTIWQTSIFSKDAEKHLKLLRELKTRDDDVLLCTAPKSGTHLVHEILSMLLSQTSEYNSKGNLLDMYLEYQEPEVIESMKNQRLMISHLPLSLLPIQHQEKGCKIVYVNRNPKDRHVSMFNFLCGKMGVPKNFQWSEYFNKHVIYDTFMTGWFNFTREMTTAVHNKSINIIQVLYEDLLMDPREDIKRLAEFLDVPYTEHFISSIVNKCKFDNLKANKIDASQPFAEDGKSTLFRKGKIGDWKNWITVAQNEQFDATFSKEMENVDVKFTFE